MYALHRRDDLRARKLACFLCRDALCVDGVGCRRDEEVASAHGAAAAVVDLENMHANRNQPEKHQAAAEDDVDDVNRTEEVHQGDEEAEGQQMAGAEEVDACAATKDHVQTDLELRDLFWYSCRAIFRERLNDLFHCAVYSSLAFRLCLYDHSAEQPSCQCQY